MIKYVELVSGEDNSGNIKCHAENPISKKPIPCYNEEREVKPMLIRRVVGIEIDNSNIVIKFVENGFKPATEKGLRFPVADDIHAIIGEKFPKI